MSSVPFFAPDPFKPWKPPSPFGDDADVLYPQLPDGASANTWGQPNTNTVPSDVTAAGTAWLRNAKMIDSVGFSQPNHPQDVALLQRLINEAYSHGYIQKFAMGPDATGPGHTMVVNGIWQPGAPINGAILQLERLYFHGRSNPHGTGVVDANGEFFNFLVELVRKQRQAEVTLAVGMEKLGDVMLTGDAAQVKKYLPLLLDEMTARKLEDTDMILVLLANIYCETTSMEPIDEGVSHYNTTGERNKRGVYVPSGELFDKYDFRRDLGNDAVGDGAKYKGRGFIQITGRRGYQDMQNKIGVDLVAHPEKADDPPTAAKIAAQYIKDRESKFREAIKNNDVHLMRGLVNGVPRNEKRDELHYEMFRDSFNRGRKFVGDEMISEATAAAARHARFVAKAAAEQARREAARRRSAEAAARKHPHLPAKPSHSPLPAPGRGPRW